MTVIHKAPAAMTVQPNLTDYDASRASFDWSDVPNLCEGMEKASTTSGMPHWTATSRARAPTPPPYAS